MTIPLTLVTGFLGAGKTTFINRLLEQSHGISIAAIVNDFGAINIDADLVAERSETVIGLKNGCICCSLQGDLLRTLKQIVASPRQCDRIVIEASGVADPQGIVETLRDPVFHEAVQLDAIVAVVGVETLADEPELRRDPLWRAQTDAADFIALSKTGDQDQTALRDAFMAAGKALVFDSDAPIGFDMLFQDPDTRPAAPSRSLVSSDRFRSFEWTWAGSIAPDRFQALIQQLAPMLVRAKGILNLKGRGETSFSFHLVGRRATLEPLARHYDDCRLVLIGEAPRFDIRAARERVVEAFADMELLQNGR